MAIKITGLFDPGGGEYPLLQDIHLLGGFQVVSTVSDRDSITSLRRKWGMLCYVIEDNTFYQLLDQGNGDITDNTNWVVASIGGNTNTGCGLVGYESQFTNDSLDDNGDLIVTHNLQAKDNICEVVVQDNNGNIVYPDNITFLDPNTLKVSLGSITPISGNWSILISAVTTDCESIPIPSQQNKNSTFNSSAFNTQTFG